jgi:hypothetical protein
MASRTLPALVLAVLPLSAAAVPVTYEFSGVLNQRGSSLPEWYEYEFPMMAEFSGSFVLDTDVLPLGGDANSAFFYDIVSDFQVRFGPGGSLGGYSQSDRPMFDGYPYTSSGYFLNDFPSNGEGPTFYYDMVNFSGNLHASPGDSPYLERYFTLGGFSFEGTMFPALPTLADFPLPSFPSTDSWSMSVGATLYDAAGNHLAQASFGGTLTDLRRVTSVPEPATWGLLLAGMLGAVALRRRASA